MARPVATYRLQLHQGFPLTAANGLVPYLHDLGISHLYASPIFKAMPGSTHGYDITDPTEINPELGGHPALEALVGNLKAHGMGLLLDIVPNHMAAHTANPWWSDLLEFGAHSRYANFFDLRFRHDGPRRYVELPILGQPYRGALAASELRLAFDDAGFFLDHAGQRLPLDPATWIFILESTPALANEAFAALLDRAETARRAAEDGPSAHREAGAELAAALRLFPDRALLDAALAVFNGGDGRALSVLDDLIDLQSWRPVHWRLSAERMSYRRFFDINGLVRLRTELAEVFDATHALVLDLVATGHVDGLRIDHVDGMADPATYLERLRDAVTRAGRPDLYIVVEKILERGERLPAWPIEGTTGYDFPAAVEGLQVEPAALAAMRAAYSDFVGGSPAYAEVLYDARRYMLDHSFHADFGAVAEQLFTAAAAAIESGSFEREILREALEEITLAQSRYRTYLRSGQRPDDDDLASLRDAIATATRRRPDRYSAIEFVGGMLLGQAADPTDDNKAHSQFVTAWQQLTPPLIAKGGEDTAFFRYNAFIALNEVGNSPGASLEGKADADFDMLLFPERAGLNASTTHDTKRGEDARARLLVLVELADDFRDLALHCHDLTSRYRHRDTAPSLNEEWYLYQSLVAAWPLDLPSRDSSLPEGDPTVNESPQRSRGSTVAVQAPNWDDFRERIRNHMTKAMREAKVATSWSDPNSDHENAVLAFVDAILQPGSDFFASFAPFAATVSGYAWLQSLSLLLLKLVIPGVPDFYQGCESWNLSLTDPDNRRPVDFDGHCRLLASLPAEPSPATLASLLATWPDGRVKMFLMRSELELCRLHPGLFANGAATRLDTAGERANDLIAITRSYGDDWLLALAPRHFVRLAPAGELPLGDVTWRDTTVTLPTGAPLQWHDALSGEVVTLEAALSVHPEGNRRTEGNRRSDANRSASVAVALRHFPVGLFFGRSHRPG